MKVIRSFTSNVKNAMYRLTMNDHCFALNYNSILIEEIDYQSEDDSTSYYLVKVSADGVSRTIKTYNHDGKISVNMTGLYKTFFDDIYSCRCKIMYIEIYSEYGEKLFDESCTTIFGTIDVGERVGPLGKVDPNSIGYVRNIEWFKNFPSKISFYTNDILEMKYYADGSTTPIVTSYSDESEIVDIDLSASALSSVSKSLKISMLDTYGVDRSTFDSTFDKTFSVYSTSDQYINLFVNNRKNGTFLRWIDKHGMWFSYLFDNGKNELSVSKSDERVSSVYSSSKTDNFEFKSTHSISRTSKRSITCSAQRVNDETFNDVESILTALYVEMYVDGEFVRVNVVSDSAEHSFKDNLHDLEIQIETEEHSYSL